MREQFEATLTGSDSPVDGIVTQLENYGPDEAYQFRSIDGTLHLVIAKNAEGHWERVDGTTPYLSGWTDELARQIVILQK